MRPAFKNPGMRNPTGGRRVCGRQKTQGAIGVLRHRLQEIKRQLVQQEAEAPPQIHLLQEKGFSEGDLLVKRVNAVRLTQTGGERTAQGAAQGF